MEIEQLTNRFEQVFGVSNGKRFFAPGRINLIGEHTDYNGGHVFPCSITIGTYGIAKKREDGRIRLYSENFPEIGVIEADMTALTYKKEQNWGNYPIGMFHFLKEAGHAISTGCDILFYGNIPNGAGLSSSASIEVLTGVILEHLYQLDTARLELILTGKKVENEFIGVASGIMDQFAIGKGKKDQAILLDCNTLEYEMVPVNLGTAKIVIMNTNKRRELADSKYNERRAECEAALAELQQFVDIDTLGELDVATFEKFADRLSSDRLRKRARHAVSENERTLQAKKALTANNLTAFGELLNASHRSLRDDYEVTGVELDILAETAWQADGVLGARMTGAGFGGCAIAIVEEEKIPAFITHVGEIYQKQVGYAADFYIAEISDGAKSLEEE